MVAASSHRGGSAFDAKASWGPKLVVVLGSEGAGVSQPIAALADRFVQIPGTGAVESLNVSVAAGITLHHITASRRGDIAPEDARLLRDVTELRGRLN